MTCGMVRAKIFLNKVSLTNWKLSICHSNSHQRVFPLLSYTECGLMCTLGIPLLVVLFNLLQNSLGHKIRQCFICS